MPVSIAPPKILNTARVAPQHGSILCLSKNKQTISSNSSPAYMRKLNCKTKFQLKWVKWNLHLQVSYLIEVNDVLIPVAILKATNCRFLGFIIIFLSEEFEINSISVKAAVIFVSLMTA